MHWNVDEYQLPASAKIVERLRANSHSFTNLVSMPPNAIVERLLAKLRFENQPHLARLARAILALPLSCLSVYETQVWLTFHDKEAGARLHLPGLGDIPPSLAEQFPLRSIPGLEEFLRYFGGMADGFLPPGSNFWDPAEAIIVSRDDHSLGSWGLVNGWEGSLTLYHGASGDRIVLHPHGYAGKWLHEIGWESERKSPFVKLDLSFPELIIHYSEYLSLPLESPERQASPFYY